MFASRSSLERFGDKPSGDTGRGLFGALEVCGGVDCLINSALFDGMFPSFAVIRADKAPNDCLKSRATFFRS